MDRREALKRTAALTGFAVTASFSAGILQGCQPADEPGRKPEFLTEEQFGTVAAMAERILPKTDTPGALDLQVPEFIDLMLRDHYADYLQKTFLDELNAFDLDIKREYGRSFRACSPEEQTTILLELDRKAIDDFPVSGQRSFYLVIKELTLLGYFSSEYVMTNLLNYHPVAGRYEGCIPYQEGDKLYVDNNV